MGNDYLAQPLVLQYIGKSRSRLHFHIVSFATHLTISSLIPLIILLWNSFDHKLLSIFIYEIVNKLVLRIYVAKVIPNLNGKICTTFQCVKNISHDFQQDSKFFEKKSLKWLLAKWSTSSLIGPLTAHMGVFVSFTRKEK